MTGFALLALLLAVPQPDLLGDGQRAFARGDLDRAEALFREHVKRFPASAEGWSNLAAVQARRGRYADAVPLYEKALRANPRLVEVHFNLAVALSQLKRFPEAARHFRDFLKSYPNEARARQLLGLCLMESGDMRGALEELEKSYRLNPRDGSILYALAYAHARGGDEEKAAAYLVKTESNPAQAKLIEGLLLYRRGMWAEAKEAFREVVRLQPDFQPAIAALGRLELLERNDAAAIPLLEKAVELNPQDAESTYQLGVLYDRNGDSEKGKKMLERAIRLRANYADPHYQLGRIYHREGDLEKALRELETAKRILPDQESIRLALGRVYQSLGRIAEARAEFEEVRRLKARVVERDRLRIESDTLMKEGPESR
ncbi:MAG: tetratricopeptide repeat protein [Bryobacteraceae bacterium]|nr:tetratricopeptide repeat protein [Bryobacteraceae bacterium]